MKAKEIVDVIFRLCAFITIIGVLNFNRRVMFADSHNFSINDLETVFMVTLFYCVVLYPVIIFLLIMFCKE